MDVSPSSLIWQFWAKTSHDDPASWHALPWHLVEVGAVAEILWATAVPAATRRHWAAQLAVDPDLLRRWIAFVTATHDLGKCSIAFQRLVEEQRTRLLAAFGGDISLPRTMDNSLRHGLISAHVLPKLFVREGGLAPLVATRYALVTGGHHGVMWDNANLGAAKLHHRTAIGEEPWTTLRAELVRWLWRAFGLPPQLPESMRTTMLTYADAVWLAGLVTVADWIGSDEAFFRYRTDPATPEDAVRDARTAAKDALRRTGWYQKPLAIPAATFPAAIRSLPPDAEPYPAQQVAVEAIQAMSSPGIAVIEYPMGWGKTEIALWAAAHWAERFDIPGFYVAMPTMTTSDQLHSRVRRHLEDHLGNRRGRVNLQLLHGQAALSAEPEIAAQAPDEEIERAQRLAAQADPEGPRHSFVQRTTWFTKRKRGLLATYGVGTVDQALMSVLQARHFFVRLHGLGGKTVIFDEVHSYDVYMSTLVDEVLRWLGSLGSPVVILSATLPRARTTAMVAAYAEGAGWPAAKAELAPYPRITTRDRDTVRSLSAPAPDGDARRRIRLRPMPGPVDDDEAPWAAVGSALDEVLREGGTAAVICNTVRQAQAAYRALARWFEPAADQLTLFHARFRQLERRRIQERVLDAFGKVTHDAQGNRIRPERHVVVATQVIEQSLDLDFDLMVSQFCPTDLLLQRAGRLQRHHATDTLRPASLRAPTLWLTGYAEGASGAPLFPRGTTRVYSEHVLLRSWLALRECEEITIPDDVEPLIEATYGDVPEVPPEIVDSWEESAYRWEDKLYEERETAKDVLIPTLAWDAPSVGNDALANVTRNREVEDDEPFLHASAVAKTRVGLPSVSLVVLMPEEAARFADALSADSDMPPSQSLIRELLLRTVSVSMPGVLRAAIGTPIPASWEKSPHLRHHRLVLLDEACRGAIGDIPVAMHPALGILIDREAEGWEEDL